MSRIVDVEPLDCLAWKDGEHGTTFDDGVLWVLEKIGELPTIEPERKKGKWTDDNACPFCGFQPWYERDIHTLSFCPNCGAKMEDEA